MSEEIFDAAVRAFWSAKKDNATNIARSQGGTRDHALRGDTMDGFRDRIIEALVGVGGVSEQDIYVGNALSALASNLPAYYRASKNWDVIVCKNALCRGCADPPRLVLAIEFKSQHRSIGNNQNNRIEESIGNAHDFWSAYEAGTLGPLVPRPWLGYLFLGVYPRGAESKPVDIYQTLLPPDPAFLQDQESSTEEWCRQVPGASYSQRYRIFLQRMLAKKLYDGACFLVTDETELASPVSYRVLYDDLSGEHFLRGMLRHVAAYYCD